MTKKDLANKLFQEVGLSRGDSAEIVERVIDTIKTNLADGKTVKIAGFGTFMVRKKSERKGRNLKTGEEIPIAPRKVVTFKASKQFKDVVEKI